MEFVIGTNNLPYPIKAKITAVCPKCQGEMNIGSTSSDKKTVFNCPCGFVEKSATDYNDFNETLCKELAEMSQAKLR